LGLTVETSDVKAPRHEILLSRVLGERLSVNPDQTWRRVGDGGGDGGDPGGGGGSGWRDPSPSLPLSSRLVSEAEAEKLTTRRDEKRKGRERERRSEDSSPR